MSKIIPLHTERRSSHNMRWTIDCRCVPSMIIKSAKIMIEQDPTICDQIPDKLYEQKNSPHDPSCGLKQLQRIDV